MEDLKNPFQVAPILNRWLTSGLPWRSIWQKRVGWPCPCKSTFLAPPLSHSYKWLLIAATLSFPHPSSSSPPFSSSPLSTLFHPSTSILTSFSFRSIYSLLPLYHSLPLLQPTPPFTSPPHSVLFTSFSNGPLALIAMLHCCLSIVPYSSSPALPLKGQGCSSTKNRDWDSQERKGGEREDAKRKI